MNQQNSTIVIDNYLVDTTKPLGKGSFGIVYECRTSTNNDLCCKLINLETIKQQNENYLKAQNELGILIQLKENMQNNTNVVQLLHACKQNIDQQEHLVVIMERCDSDLKQYLTANKVDQIKAIEILRQIINGYKICYQNKIMHRDIKPANILIKKGVFKLTDFGESKISECLNDQMQQTNTGTPIYQSPQISLGSEIGYSAKADIYSLGIVFHEMVYGKLPFAATKQAIYQFCQKILKTKSFTPQQKGVQDEIIRQDIKDLLKQMITYEESDRISWQDLFNHDLIKIQAPMQKTLNHNPNLNFNGQIPKQFPNIQNAQQSLQHPMFRREHSQSLHDFDIKQQSRQPLQQEMKQQPRIPIVNNKISEVSKSQGNLNQFMGQQLGQKDFQNQTGQINKQFTPKMDNQGKNIQNIQYFYNKQIPIQPKNNETLQNQQKFHTLPNNDSDCSITNPKPLQQEKPEQKHIKRGIVFLKKFKKEYQKIGNQNNKLKDSVDNITDICQKLLYAICYQIYQKQQNKPIIDQQFRIQDIDQLCQDKIYQKYLSSKPIVSKSIKEFNNQLVEQLRDLQHEFPFDKQKTYSKKYVWLVQKIQDIINQEIKFDSMAQYFNCDHCL
ncbi:hypothetical protein pb186bvf_010628 [Paramecium bursaria]